MPVNDALKQRIWLYVVFFIALIVRFSYTLYLKDNYFFYNSPGEDVAYYKKWAEAIVFGEVSNNAFAGMPLFPSYLATLFRICQGSWVAVGLINLVLGALNCALISLLAKKLFSLRIGIIVGLLAATNFILVYYDWLMMPITLLISLTLVILLGLNEKKLLNRQWFILGLVLGVASLGDGKFLIFSVFLSVYLTLARRETLKTLLPLFLGLILIVGGVTVRNKLVSGDWVFITSQSGLSFFVGNNPEATGAYEQPESFRPSHEGQDVDQRILVEQTLGRKATPSEVSDFYKHQAMDFIFHHPGQYLSLLLKKTALFVGDNEQIQAIDLLLQREYKLRLDYNPYLLIFPLAGWGMVWAFRQKREVMPLILLAVSQLIFCLIYFVSTRHRAAILPVLLIFETFALVELAKLLNVRQYHKAGIVIASVVLFFVVFPPKSIDPVTYLALQYSKTGSVNDSQKNYQQALTNYYIALQLQPNDTVGYYNVATAALNLQKYDIAEEFFQETLKRVPYNVDALFNLGYIYEQTGRTEKALKNYETVLQNAPDSLDAHFRIANLYQAKGQCNEAKPHFEAIIRQNPILKPEIEKLFKTCH